MVHSRVDQSCPLIGVGGARPEDGDGRIEATGTSNDASSVVNKDLRQAYRQPNSPSAAKSGAANSGTGPQGAAADPDLARIIAAWPALPGHIKSGVLALIVTTLSSDAS
jgi:hypothetical protein